MWNCTSRTDFSMEYRIHPTKVNRYFWAGYPHPTGYGTLKQCPAKFTAQLACFSENLMKQKLSNAPYLVGLASSWAAPSKRSPIFCSWHLGFMFLNASNGGNIQRKQLQNVPKDFSSKNSDFYFKGPFCEISLLFVTLHAES